MLWHIGRTAGWAGYGQGGGGVSFAKRAVSFYLQISQGVVIPHAKAVKLIQEIDEDESGFATENCILEFTPLCVSATSV